MYKSKIESRCKYSEGSNDLGVNPLIRIISRART